MHSCCMMSCYKVDSVGHQPTSIWQIRIVQNFPLPYGTCEFFLLGIEIDNDIFELRLAVLQCLQIVPWVLLSQHYLLEAFFVQLQNTFDWIIFPYLTIQHYVHVLFKLKMGHFRGHWKGFEQTIDARPIYLHMKTLMHTWPIKSFLAIFMYPVWIKCKLKVHAHSKTHCDFAWPLDVLHRFIRNSQPSHNDGVLDKQVIQSIKILVIWTSFQTSFLLEHVSICIPDFYSA